MRVCISVTGTNGDVLPMLSLAIGLQRCGHSVRFATADLYRSRVEGAGVEFFPLRGSPQGFFGGRTGIGLREMVRKPAQFQRFWDLCVGPYAQVYLHDTWEAAKDCDTVVCIPWFQASAALEEKLGNPCFASTVMPAIGIPSRHMFNHMNEEADGEQKQTALRSWKDSHRLIAAPFRQVNEWRTSELGLMPWSKLELHRHYRHTNFLLSYSRHVLPSPPDWPSSVHVTGFWYPDAPTGWHPSAELLEFLEKYPECVLVGFSSQKARDPQRFTEKILEALTQSGKAAILLKGWGGLREQDVPSNMILQDAIPYDWIVPRVSAFLHHGGCGSMAAALRYGVPSAAIPFGFDQMLWGKRIAELGCGVGPFDPDTFEVETLRDAMVRLVEDPSLRRRAQEMSVLLRAEDGVAAAVETMERVMGIRRDDVAVHAEPGMEESYAR